jgi:hypothetical protein
VFRAFAPLVIGGSLALGAWHVSGSYFSDEAKQRAANDWDKLRVCLVGDALPPGQKPSDRVRLIELANHRFEDVEPWPDRCAPYAEALDEALAARAIVSQIGPMPSAVKIVKGTDDAAHRSDLDLLFAELEAAALPLPKYKATIPSAPTAVEPLFKREELKPLGKVLELRDVATALDPSTGRVLRMLLPESQVQTCHFNTGSPEARWRSVVCSASPLTIPRDAKLSLAPTEAGGTDLIRIRDSGDTDGIYDASTGLKVQKARYFDTQTHVSADGSLAIVYAKLRGDSRLERVEHFRLLTSQPGDRPRTRRLKIPKTARIVLQPGVLLWSIRGDDKKGDELVAQPLTGKRRKPLGDERTLAMLPHGSRFLASCADGKTTALLFGAGLKDRRYTLIFGEEGHYSEPHDVGTIAGRVTMSCHEGKAMLLRTQHDRVSRWQCDAKKCQLGLSDPLPEVFDPRVHVVGPVGEKVAVAWKDDRGAFRLRVATPDALAKTPDTVVLDEWQQGGVEMSELRLVSASSVGMLLAQDVGRRVYALRIDPSGAIETVKMSR